MQRLFLRLASEAPGPQRLRMQGSAQLVLIVKRHVGHAGFTTGEFGGHSLHSSLAASAAAA